MPESERAVFPSLEKKETEARQGRESEVQSYAVSSQDRKGVTTLDDPFPSENKVVGFLYVSPGHNHHAGCK